MHAKTLLSIGTLALLTLAALPPPAAAVSAPLCAGVADGYSGSCRISCDVFRSSKIVRVAGAGDSVWPYYAAVGFRGCGAEEFYCYFSYVTDPGQGAAVCTGYVPATTAEGYLTCFAEWFFGPFSCAANEFV